MSGETPPDPAIREMLLTGERRRAAWHVRRKRDLPDRDRLLLLATSEDPLPEPWCGCAGHPERCVEPPPSHWLKPFYDEGDSIYDAMSYLCLSCHTIWTETDDSISNTHDWERMPFEGFTRHAVWHLGMDDAWPGDSVMADRRSFVQWIRGLARPTFSRGMV